tara:strand:+ start:35 stop:292 length:258 start_codon:yes stop_codon:yes gene_type:complete
MNYPDRTYATANTSTLENVDFTQIGETSADTIRKSVDKSQFVLKWQTVDTPTFIANSSVTLTWSGSHAECLNLMTGSFWQSGSTP